MAKPVITDKPIIDQAEFNGITIWRKNIEYDKFNEYIGLLLDEYEIDSKIEGRRRMFDHFLWFANR